MQTQAHLFTNEGSFISKRRLVSKEKEVLFQVFQVFYLINWTGSFLIVFLQWL